MCRQWMNLLTFVLMGNIFIFMHAHLSTHMSPVSCASSQHGVTSVSPWVWPVRSRGESGCVCGGGRSAEGGRDALQPPTQWRFDRQWLEEGKSIGSSTDLWPGESANSRGHSDVYICYVLEGGIMWCIEHFVQWQQQYSINEVTGGNDSKTPVSCDG